MSPDELIEIPESLQREVSDAGVTPMACGFCTEVACETDAMLCGECSGQSCSGQCDVSQCGSCQSGCQSGCQSACQNGCQSACESSAQNPTSYGSISIGVVTSDSISLTLAFIQSATSYLIAYRPSSTSTADSVETTSRTYTLTGLEPNTEYAINYRGLSDYGMGPYMPDPVYATTEPESVVEPWSWTSSNGSATAAQTKNAYSILLGNRVADDFSHNVWNDLIDKIVEMREAQGLSWTTNGGVYLTASECKVSSGDTLTAEIYNSMKVNVGSISSTDIQDVEPGDEITGYHITHVVDVLNDIIGGL